MSTVAAAGVGLMMICCSSSLAVMMGGDEETPDVPDTTSSQEEEEEEEKEEEKKKKKKKKKESNNPTPGEDRFHWRLKKLTKLIGGSEIEVVKGHHIGTRVTNCQRKCQQNSECVGISNYFHDLRRDQKCVLYSGNVTTEANPLYHSYILHRL